MSDPTNLPPGHVLGTPLSRRRFLTGTAAVSLAAVMAGHLHQVDEVLSAVGLSEEPAGASSVPTLSFEFSVARDADLALLDIAFYGFETTTVDGVLAIQPFINPGNLVTVQFPPQAIGEAAYNWVGGTWAVDPPPVLSAMAGPSVLCFTLRAGESVTFPTMTDQDLLDWSTWTLLVPASAQGSTPGAPTNPVFSPPTATYVEYPFALFLAPTVVEGVITTFVTRDAPPLVSPAGVGDLFSASLAQATTGGTTLVPEVAAVWAVDAEEPASKNVTPEQYISYVT
jgi:hypothetical protein